MAAGVLQCAPEQKAPLEARNAVAQLEYLKYLVVDCGLRELRESHVLELQKLAVQGIYPCGGRWRDVRFQIEISQSCHSPPESSLVPSLVREMIDRCNDPETDYLKRASFALWRFNWIHPFAGGNGRTARALAYLIVCMHNNGMLPGKRTMPGLIASDRDGYISALQAVDAAVSSFCKEGDLSSSEVPTTTEFLLPMAEYLGSIYLEQLRSA